MAQPARLDELTAAGSLSAGAAIAVVQSGGTFRTTPRAFITEAISFSAEGAGAVARTMQKKGQELFSVKDFGCTGDGTTDDAANFQACIDAAEAASKAKIIVPPGTYRLTVQATDTVAGESVRRCLELAGDDIELELQAGAVLKVANSQASGTQQLAIIRIGTTAGATKSRIRISGPGKIDGNSANQTSTPSDALWSSAILAYGTLTDIDIDGIEIVDHIGDAVFFRGIDTSNRVQRAKIRNCRIDNCYEGVVWAFANYVRVTGNHIHDMNTQDGIEPSNGTDYWWIEDNVIDTIGSGNSGIDIFSTTTKGFCRGNVLVDCDIDVGVGSTGDVTDILIADNILNNGQIQVGAGTGVQKRIIIQGNSVTKTVGNGIEIQDGSECIIKGNLVFGCSLRGIYLQSADADNCVVTGNICLNNGTSSTAGATSGIQASSCLRPVITGNLILDTQGSPTQGSIALGGTTDAVVVGNTLAGNTTNVIDYQAVTTGLVNMNKGHVTENSGTATVANGQTSVAVTHGISNTNVALGLQDISVTPTNNMGNANKFWTTIINATSFRISVDVDPGATTATFAWRIRRTGTA